MLIAHQHGHHDVMWKPAIRDFLLENATPLYKHLDILKLDNVFNLKISVLVHKIKYAKTNIPNTFSDLILPVQDIHKYNTRYASKDNYTGRPPGETMVIKI